MAAELKKIHYPFGPLPV